MKRRATAEPADRAAAILQGFDVAGFRCRLVDWFRHQQRDLPWRRDRDPYKIWVSEVMLQQTRVETALPYFLRFVERFPTVEALAAAEEADVLKLWEGLGYYSRARNLLRGARQVMEEFGGVLPDDPEELARIKGIGPYTAGAILSIAYGRPVPAVDGNVLRVLSRLLLVEEDVQKPGTRRLFTQLAAELVCPDDPSAFNQGLMELGALVCTPRAPKCLLCPVREDCRAYAAGRERELPAKGKRKAIPTVDMVAAVVWRGAAVYVYRRPEGGLLGGLWAFPDGERRADEAWEAAAARILRERYGLAVAVSGPLLDVVHTFSHCRWNLRVFQCAWVAGDGAAPDGRWVEVDKLDELAFPASHKKIVAALDGETVSARRGALGQ